MIRLTRLLARQLPGRAWAEVYVTARRAHRDEQRAPRFRRGHGSTLGEHQRRQRATIHTTGVEAGCGRMQLDTADRVVPEDDVRRTRVVGSPGTFTPARSGRAVGLERSHLQQVAPFL